MFAVSPFAVTPFEVDGPRGRTVFGRAWINLGRFCTTFASADITLGPLVLTATGTVLSGERGRLSGVVTPYYANSLAGGALDLQNLRR